MKIHFRRRVSVFTLYAKTLKTAKKAIFKLQGPVFCTNVNMHETTHKIRNCSLTQDYAKNYVFLFHALNTGAHVSGLKGRPYVFWRTYKKLYAVTVQLYGFCAHLCADFYKKICRGFTAHKAVQDRHDLGAYGVPFQRKRGKTYFAEQNTGCSEKDAPHEVLVARKGTP